MIYRHSNFYSRMFWLSGGRLFTSEVEKMFPEQYTTYYPPIEEEEPEEPEVPDAPEEP